MDDGAEVGGQGIHARHTDPVQTARDLVGVFVELAARPNLRHDDLEGADAFLFVHVYRDASAVVRDPNAIAFSDGDRDGVAMACKCFVDGVVDHLVHQMVEASTPTSPMYIDGRMRTCSIPSRA